MLQNERELATVLAALRNWQMELSQMSQDEIDDMGGDCHFEGVEGGGLDADEIDSLCERLNMR